MELVELYRAVSVAELADIAVTGEYRIPPGGVEGKYFALSMTDARYFRDQAILSADSIVQSSVLRSTFNTLEHGVFDYHPGVFVNLDMLSVVNSDAVRFRGIRHVE